MSSWKKECFKSHLKLNNFAHSGSFSVLKCRCYLMEGISSMGVECLMKFPTNELKRMCTSFLIEQGNSDDMARCVADVLMSLSSSIDENIMLPLDSDLNDL